VHFNITEYPTGQWTAQQMVEASPWDEAPRYLLRDRSNVYNTRFRRRVHSLGIEEVLAAPRSPGQNPSVERLIGSVRRVCLDHVIVLNERHLKRLLRAYFSYYHAARTHLALDKQSPQPRQVESPDSGEVIAFPHIGGLHHEHRRAA
ncbi:MAG: integrase core domain-containing protein, partial [Pseudomonadota bacterium]|nr:integrase core domain-containing protein [Pseudomonadota bacterium]